MGNGSPQTAVVKLVGLSGGQLHCLAVVAASVVACYGTPVNIHQRLYNNIMIIFEHVMAKQF